jgi:hypothetical protein
LVAFLVGLLLAAISPRRPRHVQTISEAREEAEEKRAVERVFNSFFWVLLIGFGLLIVLGYAVETSSA